MKYLTITCIFFTMLLQGTAQNARDIVQQHITAIGGMEKIKSEKTIRSVGTFESMMMGAGTIETISIDDKGFRMSIKKGDTTRSTVMYEHFRWMEAIPGKKSKAVRLPDEAWNSLDLDLEGEIVDYERKGHTAQYIGKEKIDNQVCYSIRLVNQSGKVTYYSIDTATLFIVQSKVVQLRDGKEVELGTSKFGDYRKISNGTYKPFLLMQLNNGKVMMTTRQNLIEVNGTLNMQLFERLSD
jgi:hypothetical protein